MKRVIGVLTVVMMMVVTAPAMAGDANKCSASTQDCLNHMAKNLNNRGWVGIEMDDKGGAGMMIVTKVIDGSPAQKAGFEVGDALVAVNGVAFSDENEKQLKDITKVCEDAGMFKLLCFIVGFIPVEVIAFNLLFV